MSGKLHLICMKTEVGVSGGFSRGTPVSPLLPIGSSL